MRRNKANKIDHEEDFENISAQHFQELMFQVESFLTSCQMMKKEEDQK